MHILLVEDDDGYARMIVQFLKDHSIIRCISMKDAFSVLNSQVVDLVILDLNLPDSEGIDTFAAVIDFNRDLPVIVLTGNAEAGMSKTLMQLGAQAYLQKSWVNSPHVLEMVVDWSVILKALAVELRQEKEFHEDRAKLLQEIAFLFWQRDSRDNTKLYEAIQGDVDEKWLENLRDRTGHEGSK